ncbi:MAG: ADOP family duplicated permease [Blastocatellales bacterium]
MPEWKREIRKRLAGLRLSPTRETEIVEELSQHLEDRYAELLTGGATPEESQRAALAELSDNESLAHELQRVERQIAPEPIAIGINRRGNMIADFWQDLRFGARMLMKHSGFTLITVLTLALGIGANTAMFSFIDAALLKPLAYRAPDRLVMVWERLPNGSWSIPDIPTFQEWRTRNKVFSHLAAVTSVGGGLYLTGRERAERVRGSFVSANYFDLLGARPALGRGFNADEERAGKEHVVMLSNRCWRQRFGADPNVVGASVTLNNESYTVIGVLPPHGIFDRGLTEVWLPLVFTTEQIRSQSRFFTTLARLKPGVTIEQAEAEMKRATEGLAQQGVTANKNVSAFVQPLRDNLVGDSLRKMLLLLMGAVFFILLIACANVANLLLARASARQRETAVRATLGASRSRIIRQLLTESALLAAISGGVGIILAFWLIKGFTALMPRFTIPIDVEVAVDWRVLLFTASVSLLTAAIFGLAPAWQASRLDLTKALQERGYGASARFGRDKLRGLLLVSEIALTFTLVIGAALLIRSFTRLLQVDAGFQTERILTFQTDLDKTRYPQAHQLLTYQTEMLNRMRALPDAQSAAVTNTLPLSGSALNMRISIPARPPTASATKDGVGTRAISADYFNALGIRLLKGRFPSDRDTAETPPVIVINQSLAKRHWPDRDLIGEQIQFAGDKFASLSFTIIGVVSDIRHRRLEEEPKPEVYVLFSQMPEKALASFGRTLHFAIRTTNEPSALTSAIRTLAAGVDKNQPLYEVRTMEEMYSKSVATPRFQTILFSLFGALALTLAAVGLYGVMAYSVTQRTHEIGVRVALGAQTRDVMKLVMAQGAVFTLAGLAIGFVAAIGLSRYLSGFLYEIKPTDAVTYLAVASLLGGVATLACYLPARRAAKVDPMVALRHE